MQKLHDTTGKIQKLNDTLKPPTIKHTYDILKPPKVLLMHVKTFHTRKTIPCYKMTRKTQFSETYSKKQRREVFSTN